MAGLPTSSRDIEELGQSPECRSIPVDPLLVTRRQQHQDDIFSLAAAESEELSVPVCHDTHLQKGNWVVDCKGRWTLPVEQHEFFPFLRDHLKADDLWQEVLSPIYFRPPHAKPAKPPPWMKSGAPSS